MSTPHDRLLAAAKSVLATKKYFNPSPEWHYSWKLAVEELHNAVEECERAEWITDETPADADGDDYKLSRAD